MTRPTKVALTTLIYQQKTALDQMLKKQIKIVEMAPKLYSLDSPEGAKIYEKLAHVKRYLYKAGLHCGSCAEKL